MKELFHAAKFTHLKMFAESQTFLNNKLNLLTIGTLYRFTAVNFWNNQTDTVEVFCKNNILYSEIYLQQKFVPKI